MKTLERVLGWDLLRGLCAIAVTCYHLLYWQKVTELHVFGTYGVYLFFVLSGASLAYTYAGRISAGQFSFRGFLWVRYLRLAPLYLALMLVVLPWKLLKDGAAPGLLGCSVPLVWRYSVKSILSGRCATGASALGVGAKSVELLMAISVMVIMCCYVGENFRRLAGIAHSRW